MTTKRLVRGFPLLLLFSGATALLFCEDEKRDLFPARHFWWNDSGTAYQFEDGNSYISDYQRYPGYALLFHNSYDPEFTAEVEKQTFERAAQLGRKQFSKAYREERLLEWDDWGVRVGQNAHAVPFKPRFVVVILEHHPEEEYTRDSDVECKWAKVGYVMAVKDFFDEKLDLEKLRKSAWRNLKPMHRDPQGITPGYEEIYTIIEKHRTRSASRTWD